MVGFILLAAALLVAAVLVVVVPLLRKAGGLPPATWTAFGVAGVLVVGSALLYVTWSNWPWHTATPPDSPQTMVARLARKLERNPQDVAGWLTLGRSYTVLQEYPLALRAFERADRLSDGKNADALTGEAEALTLGDDSELDGRAARLIERALVVAPDSAKALVLGAMVAARRGDLPLARQRFTKVLGLNPPDNIRAILVQQIAAIDARLASPGTPQTPVTPGAAGAQPAVRVHVTLSPHLSVAPGNFPLFVFVRNPQAAGPPLAVKRLTNRFPQDVELTAADSMIPGRVIGAGTTVEVVARIARSGNPVGASGDPYGVLTYKVGVDGQGSLVIDRLMP
ncbi:MAG TPA: tetratricopeptide repeat protein [Steroidobacteraceae bacterium]